MNEIQKLALEKLNIKADRSAIPAGTHTVAPFVIEVSGELDVAPEETYTPTTDIPLIPTVALALKKMGIQRDHFLGVLREAAMEVVLQDREMRTQLLAQSGLSEFEAEFRQKVLAALPRKTRVGKVNAAVRVVQVVQAGVVQ